MTETDNDDAMIDALFRDARAIDALPDDGLMARVMADAHRAGDGLVAVADQSWWTTLSDILGGWPTVGGLALAGVAGLWVGVAPPTSVENLAASIFGTTDTVSFIDDDLDLGFGFGVLADG